MQQLQENEHRVMLRANLEIGILREVKSNHVSTCVCKCIHKTQV